LPPKPEAPPETVVPPEPLTPPELLEPPAPPEPPPLVVPPVAAASFLVVAPGPDCEHPTRMGERTKTNMIPGMRLNGFSDLMV
jgi:hypothetical protein